MPLEGEVGGGVDPTLALNLLVPGGEAGGVSAGGTSPPPPALGTLAALASHNPW